MSTEPTAFLYPFIEADERDSDAVLAHLASSAREKIATSKALRAATLDDGAVAPAAAAIAARVADGGRVFVFGNGGSSTDADALVAELTAPRTQAGSAVPALSLVADPAILTALANDIGHDVVFARQLAALGDAPDVAIGISTSGGSANVVAACAEAHRRGMLTVATCGYDGGALAAGGDVDHCIVVRSDSVHRIQEAQTVVLRELSRQVRATLTGGPR